MIFVFRLFVLVQQKTENEKTRKRKSIFVFRLFVLVRQKKTENDKTEVDFCFSFIYFSSDKKQKTIKRKLIFVLCLFGLVRQKTENDKTAPRKYVFWDAIQYFTGQRYTLTKLQNAGNFKLFSHRVVTTAKKAQNLERTLVNLAFKFRPFVG